MTLFGKMRYGERPSLYCVVGVYDNSELAEEALRFLDAAGFPIGQITIVSLNPRGPGLLLTGSLALVLLGHVEGVLYWSGAAGWLWQLMAWGIPPGAIHYYEKEVKAGRTLLLAHGHARETARAQLLLTAKGALQLHLHPKSRTEWEEIILKG